MALNANLTAWIQTEWDKYHSNIARLLGLPDTAVMPQIKIVHHGNVSGEGGAVATTGNGVLTIDADYFKGMNNPGGLIHEFTHWYIENNGGGASDSWNASEGLADAVRYILGPGHGTAGQPGWTPNHHAQVWINAYRKQGPQYFSNAATAFAQGTTFSPHDLASGALTTTTSTNGTGTGTSGSTSGGVMPHKGHEGGPGQGGQPENGAGGPGSPPSGPGKPPGNPNSTQTAKRQRAANLMATYEQTLSSWGIPMDANLKNLIANLAHHDRGNAYFMQQVEQTPEFQKRFPGIFASDGTLKMSPTAYISQEKSYQAIATKAGINLNDAKTAYLFRNDVSSTEFSVRATALQRLRDNKDMFTAFSKQLAQEGLAPPGGLSKQDMFKFVLGQGNQEWYKSWNNSVSRYYGNQAGLNFSGGNGDLSLGQQAERKIAAKGLSESALQSGYQALAQQLKTTMPMSRVQKFGLSKQDLIELEFGGKRQAAVAQKVQQIINNQQAFTGDRASLGAANVGKNSQAYT